MLQQYQKMECTIYIRSKRLSYFHQYIYRVYKITPPHMDHPVYYHLLLLLLPNIIRKSVHQKCMIIIILYSIDTVRETRVVQVKMVKFFVFFVFFLEKKSFVFWWLYVFFCVFLIFWQKSATYDWFLLCAEKKKCLQVRVRENGKKILTTYLSLKKRF